MALIAKEILTLKYLEAKCVWYEETSTGLIKANNWVVMIRGNHAAPAYFQEQQILHERFVQSRLHEPRNKLSEESAENDGDQRENVHTVAEAERIQLELALLGNNPYFCESK